MTHPLNFFSPTAWGLHDLLRPMAWLLLGAGLGWWLRRDLTPKLFLTLFESENSFSLRLLLAGEIVVWLQFMDSAGRLKEASLNAWLLFVGTLLGLGVAKVVSKAWANKPEGNTTVNAKSVNASVKTENVNLSSEKSQESESL